MNKLLACVAFVLFPLTILTGCSRSADSTKIVGTWESSDIGYSVCMLFSSDGTLIVDIPFFIRSAGTWTIKDDQLKMTYRDGTETVTIAAKIIKLDDTALVYEAMDKNRNTQTSTWVRKQLDDTVVTHEEKDNNGKTQTGTWKRFERRPTEH